MLKKKKKISPLDIGLGSDWDIWKCSSFLLLEPFLWSLTLTYRAVMKFLFIFRFLIEACKFCAKIIRYLTLSMIPSILTTALVSAELKQPYSISMLHCGYSSVWMMTRLVFVPTYLLKLWSKSSVRYHQTFCGQKAGLFMCVCCCCCFCLATLPHAR